MRPILLALSLTIFTAAFSADVQEPFAEPRKPIDHSDLTIQKPPPRPERLIAKLPGSVTYRKVQKGHHSYTVAGIYNLAPEKRSVDHEYVYKMVVPNSTSVKFDWDKQICQITTSRELSYSNLAYAIDDMAHLGGVIPYWHELEARDIPKSRLFSEDNFSISPFTRELPKELAWFDLSGWGAVFSTPFVFDGQRGKLLIVSTTADCMACDKFAIRILDSNGKLVWKEEGTMFGNLEIALMSVDGHGNHQVLLKRDDHGDKAQFQVRIGIEQPGAGQPAAQPADTIPPQDQPSTPMPKDAPR